MAGACILALSCGDFLAALEIVGILGFSMLLESHASRKLWKARQEALKGNAANMLIMVERGAKGGSEISASQANLTPEVNAPVSMFSFTRYPPIRRADELRQQLVGLGTLAIAGTFLTSQDSSRAFSVALAVACPYATVLASSAAFTCAQAGAARSGILIESGLALERFGEADSLCFVQTPVSGSHQVSEEVLRCLRKEGVQMIAKAQWPQEAIELADITLVDASFEQLLFIRQLSHKTLCIMEQNHWLAVAANIAELALEFGDCLTPLTGNLLHLARGLGIMLNSIRLLKWKPARQTQGAR